MAHWLVTVPGDRHVAERLYYHEEIELPAGPDAPLRPGDHVVLASGDPLMVFGLGRVTGWLPDEDYDPDDPDAPERGEGPGEVAVRYTHRRFDEPVPATGFSGPAGTVVPLREADFTAIAERVGPEHAVGARRRSWLVGVDLPIEASSPAEAVRQFWTYVTRLGPGELPTFVSPAEDELAMRAYVLGDVANLDPEEEGEWRD